MVTTIIIIIIAVVAAFFLFTKSDKPVEEMHDRTLRRLAVILDRQVMFNINNRDIGTDKDMAVRAKLKAVQDEIERRRTLRGMS